MKVTSKELIESYLSKSKENCFANSNSSLNLKEFDFNVKKYLKRIFIDLLTEIERWDLIVNTIIIHPNIMFIIKSFLKGTIDVSHIYYDNGSKIYHKISMWGCTIEQNESINEDTIIAISEDYFKYIKENDRPDDGRNISIATLNIEALNKAIKMQVFC